MNYIHHLDEVVRINNILNYFFLKKLNYNLFLYIIRMSHTTLDEYNDYLIKNLIKINLKDYIIQGHIISNSNLDMIFVDYFIELQDYKDKFYVNYNKLKDFGIIDDVEYTNIMIYNILKGNFKLFEGVDWRSYIVNSIEKEYYLTPKAFKLCLIRSNNSKYFSKNYKLLENCVHNYKLYQAEINKSLLPCKIELKDLNDKIDLKDLNDKIDKCSIYIKDLSDKIDLQSNYIKDLIIGNNSLNEQNEKLIKKIDNLQNIVDSI